MGFGLRIGYRGKFLDYVGDVDPCFPSGLGLGKILPLRQGTGWGWRDFPQGRSGEPFPAALFKRVTFWIARISPGIRH
jgi:hypothetical protein